MPRTAPPPHNLPVEHAPAAPHEAEGAFPITQNTVARLRVALAQDLGYEGAWSDDEIRDMARSTLMMLRVLLEVARAQRARGLE